MSESPKRIWVIRNRYVVDPEKTCERIVPYIRADLVDELVEVLKYVMTAHGEQLSDAFEKAQAALKAREEE